MIFEIFVKFISTSFICPFLLLSQFLELVMFTILMYNTWERQKNHDYQFLSLVPSGTVSEDDCALLELECPITENHGMSPFHFWANPSPPCPGYKNTWVHINRPINSLCHIPCREKSTASIFKIEFYPLSTLWKAHVWAMSLNAAKAVTLPRRAQTSTWKCSLISKPQLYLPQSHRKSTGQAECPSNERWGLWRDGATDMCLPIGDSGTTDCAMHLNGGGGKVMCTYLLC